MSIEIGLLILESVLLVATIVLLVFSLREGRVRNALLLQVQRATKILTRQEYFLTVTDMMLHAESEVIGCITGRLPKGDDMKRTGEVINDIKKLAARGVSVKYILPKFHDRLHIGHLYSTAGAEVRYSAYPLVHDIRYTVIDERSVIIGIPESTGEKEATKKGYNIPSVALSGILREHFFNCWDEDISHEAYVRETIKQTGTTPGQLERELQLEDGALDKIAKG
jgi:hypothetical protein